MKKEGQLERERERENGGDCRDRNSVDPIKAHDTFYNLINKLHVIYY